MNKIIIDVPKGIRYLGEWKGFSIPDYPCIIDKQITGCGFTEYCINNDEDSIIASPRKVLLENKESQHEGEVLYVRNEYDKSLLVDKDLTAPIKPMKNSLRNSVMQYAKAEEIAKRNEEEQKQRAIYYTGLKREIVSYYCECKMRKIPCKILVTYDSFRLVKEAFDEIKVLQNFRVVIDEFQSIFTDSRFKASTELEFLVHLQGVQKVCYVSATPMMDKYLEMLPEFCSLPYVRLDWEKLDPSRTIKPKLTVKSTKSIVTEAAEIIKKYQMGQFDVSSWVGDDGRIHEIKSTEAVLYVNSVKNICDIIIRTGLTIDNTNVLCAGGEENEKKLRTAFKRKKSEGSCIGTVPRRGEPHKMFTLCTRTVYLGADFYSTCAQTYVFSDANIDSLSVDITLDLPQILGRQRLTENPWKNMANLFYKVNLGKEMTEREFDDIIKEKERKTADLLMSYEYTPVDAAKITLADKYEKDIKCSNYKDDYVAVNHHLGSSPVPLFNNLVKVSELRAFEIQQIDYKDRFTVFNALKNNDYGFSEDDVDKVVNAFDNLTTFIDKMRLVCEAPLENEQRARLLDRIPKIFKNYYIVLGPERIRSLSYQGSKCEEEYNMRLGNQEVDMSTVIYSEFEVGKRYTKSYIKSRLKVLYEKFGYKTVAKSNDLENWFNVRRCRISNGSTGKQDEAFELLNKKI